MVLYSMNLFSLSTQTSPPGDEIFDDEDPELAAFASRSRSSRNVRNSYTSHKRNDRQSTNSDLSSVEEKTSRDLIPVSLQRRGLLFEEPLSFPQARQEVLTSLSESKEILEDTDDDSSSEDAFGKIAYRCNEQIEEDSGKVDIGT